MRASVKTLSPIDIDVTQKDYALYDMKFQRESKKGVANSVVYEPFPMFERVVHNEEIEGLAGEWERVRVCVGIDVWESGTQRENQGTGRWVRESERVCENWEWYTTRKSRDWGEWEPVCVSVSLCEWSTTKGPSGVLWVADCQHWTDMCVCVMMHLVYLTLASTHCTACAHSESHIVNSDMTLHCNACAKYVSARISLALLSSNLEELATKPHSWIPHIPQSYV